VGGDFYDVILLDAGCFALVIGDVSDKGMAAALFMAQTHSLLRAESRRGAQPGSPRAVLASVHHLLQELGRSDMFVTAFYGLVDASRRRLTYTRAGHDRPLLVRDGHVQPLGGQGTVIGFPGLDDLQLSEETLDLAPGDRLVLYTDGLTDALAPGGRAFGLERLLALLQAHAGQPAEEMVAAAFAQTAAFQAGGPQYDDMSLLVVEVT
jgi:sigma-B regulation protein RsbU (phosphoserine phosphatase)